MGRKRKQDFKQKLLKVKYIFNGFLILLQNLFNQGKNNISKFSSGFARKISKKTPQLTDILKRKPYADKIASEIINRFTTQKDKKGMTLAISAKWGSGKTFILNELLKPKLEKAGFRVVLFDPWNYSQEKLSVKRGFLSLLNKKLHSRVKLDELYSDTSSIQVRIGFFVKLLLLTISFYLLTLGIFIFYNDNLNLSIDLLYRLRDLNNGIFKNVLSYIEKYPLIFSALGFPFVMYIITQILNINHSKSKIVTSDEFRDLFLKITKGKKKLVIMVDNLDRCTPEVVKGVLDSLATFFDDKCSFIVAADHTVLERYVGSKLFVEPAIDEKGLVNEYSTNLKEKAEGRRFLKKLFDVYWQIPKPDPILFKEFISDKLKIASIKKINTEQKDQLINLLDLFLDRNPRNVERFLSTLAFYLDTVSEIIKEKESLLEKVEKTQKEQLSLDIKDLNEVLDNPTVLAKILLIQELFYPIFEILFDYPEGLIKHEAEAEHDRVMSYEFVSSKETLLVEPKDRYQYTKLLQSEPKFTNKEKVILFNIRNFLYLSGGLPSEKGPTEGNFLDLLRGGIDTNGLVKYMNMASPNRKNDLMKIAQSALVDPAVTGPAREQVVLNVIAICQTTIEWSPIFEDLYTLLIKEEFLNSIDPTNLQNILLSFFETCFRRNLLISKLFSESPFNDSKYMNLKWQAVEKIDESTLPGEVGIEFLNIIKSELPSAEAECINRTKIIISKTNKEETDFVLNLKDFFVFIVNLIFSKPIGERDTLTTFLTEIDTQKDSSSNFTEKENELFGQENPLLEMRFFLEKIGVLNKYLNYRYLKNLIISLSNFISKRQSNDWGDLVVQFIKQPTLNRENRETFMKSIFERLNSGDQEIFKYSLSFITMPEFVGYFSNDAIYGMLIDSMSRQNETNQNAIADVLLKMAAPAELISTRRTILNKSTRSKNKTFAKKARELLKPYRNLQNRSK